MPGGSRLKAPSEGTKTVYGPGPASNLSSLEASSARAKVEWLPSVARIPSIVSRSPSTGVPVAVVQVAIPWDRSNRREWLRQPRVVWRSSQDTSLAGLLLLSSRIYIYLGLQREPAVSSTPRASGSRPCAGQVIHLTALLPVSAIYQSPPRLTRSPGSLSRASPDIPLR